MELNLKGGQSYSDSGFNSYSSYDEDSTDSDFTDLEPTVYTVTSTDYKKQKSHSTSQSLSNITGVIVKIIVYVAIIAGLIYGGKFIYAKFFAEAKDITSLIKYTEMEIGGRLYIQFDDAPNEVSSIYQFSKDGEVKVHGSKDLSIVYIDKKQVGVKFNTEKYSMFNIRIGDSESTAERNMSYKYENSFHLMSDSATKSDVYYYYNTENNDCIVLVYSSNTNRIVTMTYFTDFEKISEELEYDK